MKIDPNAQAFPVSLQSTPGLTKREYFAAMAMQGILSSSDCAHGGYSSAGLAAAAAVVQADAIIDALNNESEGSAS